jgi:hypothetical protein
VLRPPEHRSLPLYFVNGWLDAAVIGGLSIVVFAAMRLLTDTEVTPVVLQSVTIMSVFVNYPHFSATVYRLYQSPDNIRQFPVTSLCLPLVLLGSIAASLWQPDLVAPYFVTLFLIWSPYHYSGQTIGITMLYARRGGFDIGRWQRLALSGFVYSTFIVNYTHSRNVEPVRRYGMVLPIVHFPAWLDAAMIAVMCVAGAAFLYFAIVWIRSQRRMLPPIVLLPAITQFVWFLPGKQTAMFYEFVPLFHSLQYLYIAWAMQIGLRLGRATAPATRPSITHESLRWMLRNYVGGLLLFIALPWLLFWVGQPMIVVAGVVAAAVNIHHFFVDGVIWKLRNTTAASPLLMNVTDFAARPAPVPA